MELHREDGETSMTPQSLEAARSWIADRMMKLRKLDDAAFVSTLRAVADEAEHLQAGRGARAFEATFWHVCVPDALRRLGCGASARPGQGFRRVAHGLPADDASAAFFAARVAEFAIVSDAELAEVLRDLQHHLVGPEFPPYAPEADALLWHVGVPELRRRLLARAEAA